VDDEQVIDLPTARHRFNVYNEWAGLKPFGIYGGRTKSVLRNIRLRRLKPEAAALPKPDANGWTTIFDGKSLEGWTLHREGTSECKVTPREDCIEMSGKGAFVHSLQARDVAVRAWVRMIGKTDNLHITLRSGEEFGPRYGACFLGGNRFTVGMSTGTKWRDLGRDATKTPPDGFFEMVFTAVGDTLTLHVDGKEVIRLQNGTHREGAVAFGVGGHGTTAQFRRVDVKVLDREPGAAPTQQEAGTPISLFDGKSLTGWRVQKDFGPHLGQGGAALAEDDHLVLTKATNWTTVAWDGEFPTDEYEVALTFNGLGPAAT